MELATRWKRFTNLICKDLCFTIAFLIFLGCLVVISAMGLLMHGDPEEKIILNMTGALVIFLASIVAAGLWSWMSFKCATVPTDPAPEPPVHHAAEGNIVTISGSIPPLQQAVSQWLRNSSEDVNSRLGTRCIPDARFAAARCPRADEENQGDGPSNTELALGASAFEEFSPDDPSSRWVGGLPTFQTSGASNEASAQRSASRKPLKGILKTSKRVDGENV